MLLPTVEDTGKLTSSTSDADLSSDAQMLRCTSGQPWFSKCALPVQVLFAEAVSPTSGSKDHMTGQLIRKSRRVRFEGGRLGYNPCIRTCSQAPNICGLVGRVRDDSLSSVLAVLANGRYGVEHCMFQERLMLVTPSRTQQGRSPHLYFPQGPSCCRQNPDLAPHLVHAEEICFVLKLNATHRKAR